MTRGEILKNLRIESGLTSAEVGKAVGVSHSTILRYESGDINMSSDMLEKLAGVYGVDVADLLNKNIHIKPDPFRALKSAIIKTKKLTEISDYSALPDESKSALVALTLEALKLYYNNVE